MGGFQRRDVGKGLSGFQKFGSRRTSSGTTRKTRLRSMMRKGIEVLALM